MSSTNRGGDRHVSDYYVTPQKEIIRFLKAFKSHVIQYDFFQRPLEILDPCAGGDAVNDMAYPQAIRSYGWPHVENIATVDERDDSRAVIKEDFLFWKPGHCWDMAITNPPFAIATQIIDHCFDVVSPGGFIIMLLRLNYFGSQERFSWWQNRMPSTVYVHSERMSFIPPELKDKIKAEAKSKGEKPKGIGSDSIEYMHAVWQVGEENNSTELFII